MPEENETPSTKPLPDTEAERLELLVDSYTLATVAQTLLNICAKKATIHGPDAARYTAEEKRNKKLWGLAYSDTNRWTKAILDHGPGSGCH